MTVVSIFVSKIQRNRGLFDVTETLLYAYFYFYIFFFWGEWKSTLTFLNLFLFLKNEIKKKLRN